MAIGAFFATAHDAPVDVLELPAEVDSGQQPGIRIVDALVRGTGIVGRVTGDFGAVALKVRGTGQGVRVCVVVQLDELATRWWSDRVPSRALEPERPRVVLVRSQGRVRGAVLLARRHGWLRAEGARATVTFDLTAADIDTDGLLVVELAEPWLPSWAARRVSACGAIGLRIDQISIRPQTAPTASTPSHDATGCPFVVLAPGDAETFGLGFGVAPPAPPVARSPNNRWTRSTPARAAFKALRIARRAAIRAAFAVTPTRRPRGETFHAVDLVTGGPVPVDVIARDPVLQLRLPGPIVHPILLGIAAAPATTTCRILPTTPPFAAPPFATPPPGGPPLAGPLSGGSLPADGVQG